MNPEIDRDYRDLLAKTKTVTNEESTIEKNPILIPNENETILFKSKINIIKDLPLHLIEDILMKLLAIDFSNMYEALLCENLRDILSSDSFWQKMCRKANESGFLENVKLSDKFSSWLEIWRFGGRIRRDGIYICKISYVRDGYSGESMYQP